MKRMLFSLSLLAACLSFNAGAVISVGPKGSVTMTFDTLPAVDSWSTANIAGTSADITDDAGLDAAVQMLQASGINTVLGTSATVNPPSANPIARWNSAALYLETRPTTVRFVPLMATLRNDTGADQTELTIVYDLGAETTNATTVVEEIPGHRVYYNLTGASGNWVLIPELSGGTPATKVATVNVGTWPSGSLLYVLWADDNAAANVDGVDPEEGAYTIDDITFYPGNPSRTISVGGSGTGTLTLDTFPTIVNGWYTRTNFGASADIGDAATLDAAVQAISATDMDRQVGYTATTTPSISPAGKARWNTTLHLIQTVPTGVGYVSLMAVLKNDTGADQPSITIAYDLNELSAAGTAVMEEIPGHRVYYSESGLAGSWTLIPEFSSMGTPGTLSATLNLGSWLPDQLLYILWADDNAVADRNNANNEEGGYTIDNFSVTTGSATFVNITSPTNNQSFAEGLPITISAQAAMPNPVASISFYDGPNLIDVATTAPFNVVLNNASLGQHTLTAVAADTFGGMLTSPDITITIVPNNPPTVALTTAPGGTVLVGLNITNTVTFSDADPGDAVVSIEFYVDDSLRLTQTAAPFRFEYCDVTAGLHKISAVAVDRLGARATNSNSLTATTPSGVTVLVPNGSDWKYLDDGTDPTVFWTQPTPIFDDSSWNSGVAELGYGDTDQQRPEVTVISFGPDPNAKHPTTFFRKTFMVADPSAFNNLVVRLLRDDGGIVYLNGTEIFRSGITNEVVDFMTYTLPQAADDGTIYEETNASPGLLVAGENTLAVEIHQTAPTSSDISFDLMLWGQSTGGPTLTITPINSTQADISWPFPSDGFLLESKNDLNAAVWDPVLEPDFPDGTSHHVMVNTATGMRFFRLRKP